MPPNFCHQLLSSGDDSRLRPAEQFVAAVQHQRESSCDALPHRRFRHANTGKIYKTARAEILHDRQPPLLAQRDQLGHLRFFGETAHREIRRVHPQQYPRLFIDSIFVIRDARAIGGSHFPQHRSALFHDFRDAKTVPDFNQFAARHDYFAPARQRRERYQHRGGAIVHHDDCFRARQAPKQPRAVDIALAARSCRDVVFEVGVLGRHPPELFDHFQRERRAPQVRMQDHSRSVDDRLQRRPKLALYGFDRTPLNLCRFDDPLLRGQPCDDVPPDLRQHSPQRIERKRAVHFLAQRGQTRSQQQFVHRGHSAQQGRLVRVRHGFGGARHRVISSQRRSPPQSSTRLYGTAPSASARCPMRSVPPPSPLTPAKSAPRMMIRGAGSMATIDEELAQLERDIRQLKIEYDMYFGGGRKRPPNEVEWRIELLVKRYAERGGELKFAQRFRFNNLSQTYAKYKDVFRKRLAQREEGKVQRHFGAAAKAIEAERARTQPEISLNEAAAAAATSAGFRGFRMVCSEPEKEPQKVDQLYDAFLRAKQEAGEETSKLNRAGFNEFVRKTTKDLQAKKNCRDVEYVVETVDGQVKLKALVKS